MHNRTLTSLCFIGALTLHVLPLFSMPDKEVKQSVPTVPLSVTLARISQTDCQPARSRQADQTTHQQENRESKAVPEKVRQKKAAPPEKTIRTPHQEPRQEQHDDHDAHASVEQSAKTSQKEQTSSHAHDLFLSKIRSRIEHQKYYPRMAKRLSHEGVVHLKLVIAANGSIAELKLLMSSGYSSLDNAALEAVKKAAPFPDPQGYDRKDIALTIPLSYSLY
ncbi:MAG: hypothetical protein C1942_02730 [Prosthecochloris sp.]|nr:hypothetical protein [Prosthecochloris sp.]